MSTTAGHVVTEEDVETFCRDGIACFELQPGDCTIHDARLQHHAPMGSDLLPLVWREGNAPAR
jgi:hypothetical protein